MSSAVNNFKWEENFGLVIDYNIVTFFRVILDGILDSILDLSTTYTHNSELQAITAPPLVSTIHNSPQHPLELFQPAWSSPAVPW
jgi:hypothetical protein